MIRIQGILQPRHEHHHMPEGEFVTGEPLDAIMWLHIFAMGIAFGVIFPIGMVCGLTKSKWHVPVQILGSCLAIAGYFLGHAHKGRSFPAGNIHSKFATWVMLTAIVQVSIGVILKLHIDRGFLGKIRQVLVKIHLVIAILFPVMSWVQMVFGAITVPGFCHEDHLGQCLAHEIMGSSFIAYGIYLTTMLFVGQKWLESKNKSQEFYDSSMITVWGIINTFTEHRWNESWSMKDYEHTSMGIIWWAAGMVGIYLSWDRQNQKPKRNHVPALVMIFTGYAMANHGQSLEVSEKVHTFFGYMLMMAGVCRIIEISFVLHDSPHSNRNIRNWQYMTPFLLIESGIMFMGATEEQMQFLHKAGIMHGAYILTMSSFAFLIFFMALILNNLYLSLKEGGNNNNSRSTPHSYQPTNTSNEDSRLSEAEEFELEESDHYDQDPEMSRVPFFSERENNHH